MRSQKFRDSRTGEIKTKIPLLEIAYFDRYNGPLDVGDFDIDFESAGAEEDEYAMSERERFADQSLDLMLGDNDKKEERR